MQIIVRDNNVEQALRALKKKLQREGVYREMKLRRHYEKPSEKRARERAAAIRRARKLERKRAEREGTARYLAADKRMSVAEAAHRPAASRPGGEAVARIPHHYRRRHRARLDRRPVGRAAAPSRSRPSRRAAARWSRPGRRADRI